MSWWIADHLAVMPQGNLGEPVGHQPTPPQHMVPVIIITGQNGQPGQATYDNIPDQEERMGYGLGKKLTR